MLLIQLPILWALYYVIRSIPAYVQGSQETCICRLVEQIIGTRTADRRSMEAIGKAKRCSDEIHPDMITTKARYDGGRTVQIPGEFYMEYLG